MNKYSNLEPMSLRQRVLELSGDRDLAECVYRIANSERMYANQVHALRDHVDRLQAQLPHAGRAAPKTMYLKKAPPESDG